MIYQFIENLSRMIMEWAQSKQPYQRVIVDEVSEGFSYRALKNMRLK
jgi:uncharacterized protein (UPF0335 family)